LTNWSRAPLPFVGVDLTAGKRPSDMAGLDLSGQRVAFGQAGSDEELLQRLGEWGPAVVAVDSPMGLPAGLCCLEEACACSPAHGTGRSAERALAQLGIPCFWTTKRSIIKAMVYRAIGLKAELEACGYVVIEVFPYAVKRVLLGKRLPKKSTAEGLAFLVAGARRLLPLCNWPADWRPGHDQMDALYCAITARAYQLGEVDLLGDEDEVPIALPRSGSASVG
jgi:predicted nuclease with RNAse H fold